MYGVKGVRMNFDDPAGTGLLPPEGREGPVRQADAELTRPDLPRLDSSGQLGEIGRPDYHGQAAGLAVLVALAEKTGHDPAGHVKPDTAEGSRAPGSVGVAYRLGYLLILLVGFALTAAFARFWFAHARLPHDFGPRIDVPDIVLFSLLTFVVWHRLLLEIVTWVTCAGVRSYRPAPPPEPGLRVAFITTFVPSSEPLDMLRRTLAGMIVADYPHDTWVLDEGDDPDARQMCERLGVRYFTRKGKYSFNTNGGVFAAKTKGGNHNAWYVHHGRDYDVVAQIDTDFRVRRDFLTKTLGYFRDPKVAFVGTPQVYGNTDNFIARGAGEQTYLFYGAIMRALSRRRMTLLIGANHVVRVAALRDIGWYRGHLTEDLATGKKFHAAGWQSVYVPEPLAIGEGPTSWASYFNQQYRWAFGCMNIFFTQQTVNLRMSLGRGLTYFLMEQYYFSGLRLAIGMALLLMYYLTGWTPGNIPFTGVVIWYFPLLAWRQVLLLRLQRLNVRPREERGIYWAGGTLSVAAIPVFLLAFAGVLRNKRVHFKTTPKGDDGTEVDSFGVFGPHMAMGALLGLGVAAGYALGHRSPVYAAWGLLSVVTYFGLAASLMWKRWHTGVGHVPRHAAVFGRPAEVFPCPVQRCLSGNLRGSSRAWPWY